MSLFAHLAFKFGAHPENLATDALGFILSRSEGARRGLLTAIGAGSDVAGPDLRFQTQMHSQENGRPDLAGVDGAGRTRVLIEAKFWAGFTEHQPVGYLQPLSDDGRLVIVGPDIRVPNLWREVRDRIERAGPCEVVTNPGALGRLRVGSKVVVVVGWRGLLDPIAQQVASEPGVLEDVRQLQALCERMDAEAFLPVTSEELTTTVFRRVHEFGSVVDDVVSLLSSERVLDTKGLRTGSSNGVYGRYARLAGVPAFIQVSTRLWGLRGPSPLWVSLFGERWSGSAPEPVWRVVAPYAAKHPQLVVGASPELPVVQLQVRAGAERHEIVDAVAKQLRELAAEIGPAWAASGQAHVVQPPTPDDP